MVARWFARETTDNGGNGTSLWDLDTTAGNTTLTAQSTQVEVFNDRMNWFVTVDQTLADGLNDWDVSMRFNSIDAGSEARLALERRDSGNLTLNESNPTASFTTTGLKVFQISWDPGSWNVGDRLFLIVQHRRIPGNHGNVSCQVAINSESFVDAPEASAGGGTDELTGTTSAVASLGNAPLVLVQALVGSPLSTVASITASLTTVGTHELESSSSAVASVSASLDIAKQIAGTATSVASISGELDVTVGLVGSIAAASALLASLAQSHNLAISTQGVASGTAALSLSVRLFASSSSVAVLSTTATQTHTPSVQVRAIASLTAASLAVRFVASLYATGDGTLVDVVDENDVGTGLFDSVEDDPASPDDADWINNAVGV